MAARDRENRGRPPVSRTVWTLGLVSMLMDVSSEMIHSLLPVFLVGSLGASVATVGLIEGVGEATANLTKVFSGGLSDRLGKRKLLAVLGYGLAALSKPLFPLATGASTVMLARFLDRFGKGVRGAPRDALIADVTPPEIRGAAFGLRQALDTVGAFAGPLVAIGLMAVLANDVRAVFWWAILPAAAAVLLLLIGVEEPRGLAAAARPGAGRRWAGAARLGGGFWAVATLGAVFTLARFSEAFLILRARDAGLPLGLAPLALIVMNVVYALVAAPAGRLSDRIDRRVILAASLVVLIMADLALGFGGSLAAALAGAGMWGLHMGLSQGLLSAMVADSAPAERRGVAFGLFNLVAGAALLVASALAGALWQTFGAAATFSAGAGFALVALVGLLATLRARPA
jgi:MFS family permease